MITDVSTIRKNNKICLLYTSVLTTPTSLVIKNTGDVPLDGEKLFRRFYHGMDGKKDSTGLDVYKRQDFFCLTLNGYQ